MRHGSANMSTGEGPPPGRRRVVLCLTACAVAAVLYFGLHPHGYDFSNHASWEAGGAGLRFEKYGMALARLDSGLVERVRTREGFSILLVVHPKQAGSGGSGHILTLHGGSDAQQLVVWQWSSHIIAMNDTDYAQRRKVGRVSARIPAPPRQAMVLALTAGRGGTTLYADGQAVASNRSLLLHFPAGRDTLLVLGNSVYGDEPWQGTVAGLALFDRELEPGSVASLYDSWAGTGSLASAGGRNPAALYLFTEKGGSRVFDAAGGAQPLDIPRRATPPRRKMLAGVPGDAGPPGGLARDALLNVAGFLPVGFLCTAALGLSGRASGGRAAAGAVLFCFALSLTIETLQGWIPSRSSQMTDLILNTAGAIAGAFAAVLGAPRLIWGWSEPVPPAE